MAKKRNSTKKVSKQAKTKELTFNPIKYEIIAVLIGFLAIMLLAASFNLAGGLGEAILSGFKVIFGSAVYAFILILLVYAYQLFRLEDFPKKFRFVALFIVLVSLSGIFGILSEDKAFSLNAIRSHGGLVGWTLDSILVGLIGKPLSILLMVITGLIGLILAANKSIKDLFSKEKATSDKKQADSIDKDPKSQDLNRLAIRGTIDASGDKKSSSSKEQEPIKPSKTLSALVLESDPDWQAPKPEFLEATTTKPDAGDVKENAKTIKNTFADFNIAVEMHGVNIGPTVSQYSLKPPPGVRLTKLTTLDHNLALALAAHPIRIEAPIPGKSLVGVEMPNKRPAVVRMRDSLFAKSMQSNPDPLSFVIGRDVNGEVVTANLAKMPHLLIAGATGSGKSVTVNSLIVSMLYRNSPNQLKLILVDPKRVEMTLYNDIPHLLTPVIVEPEKTVSALRWAVAEMDRRYRTLSSHRKRNIDEYNEIEDQDNMPYIVIVIDELADLMAVAANEVEGLIVRLAQMARAVGIHLVLATQRPSVDVITGLIKANFPARIALSTTSQIDSRTIIDQAGAEKLLGKGDLLLVTPDFLKPRRVQGVFLSEKEVSSVTNFLREQRPPSYDQEILAQAAKLGNKGSASFGGGEDQDDLYQDALEVVISSGNASASMLQRRLRVGFQRASRLLDMMEENGIISPQDGQRSREVLVDSIEQANQLSELGDQDSELDEY
ncbi:DNA translocase FtsK [Candidatus Nomurabacteria bacterium]|nr:DNA translocase FtsK [Candidatus Nomurabacteria bacterium]